MKGLLREIRNCQHCKAHLPLGPRPIVSAHPSAKLIIIGQAPGSKVHQSGIPWDDPSGRQLRQWLNISNSQFYDESKVALIPMGFCYPGKGKGGDLPPRPECAPMWHKTIISNMPKAELILLIGAYSQKYYLGSRAKVNLTQTVRSFQEYLPQFLPLPHPSPRNRFWQAKNPWFQKEVVPILQAQTASIFGMDE